MREKKKIIISVRQLKGIMKAQKQKAMFLPVQGKIS
jgi:hypothetical protein